MSEPKPQFEHVPTEERARAVWVQIMPIEDLMWLLGAVATAIGRNLGMSEVAVYERAAAEARKDPILQEPPG